MSTIPKKPDFMSGDYAPSFKHINDTLICVDVRIHAKDAATRATAAQRRAFVKYLSWFYTELANLGSVDAVKATHPSIFPQITVRAKKTEGAVLATSANNGEK